MLTRSASRSALVALGATLVLAVCVAVVHALEVPPLRAHVNDNAHLLPPDRSAALEARLSDYEARTKHQLALLTVPSLAGDSLEDFSIHVAEQWKLGHKGVDDGLVLVVAPNDHKMRIEVGYGLEGVIPDAIAARIVRDVLAPAFRRSDFAGGIDAAFGALMHAASGDGEKDVSEPTQPVGSVWALLAPMLLPLLIFVFFSIVSGRGGYRRRGYGGFFMGPTGGGWGSSGSGGGFGGGGGGGFGGGGASGSW